MARQMDIDLGLLGGGIGILIGIIGLLVSGVGSLVNLRFEPGVVTAVVAIVLGLVALFGARASKNDQLIGGAVMITVAVLGFALVSGFYVISSIIVLVAGIIALVLHFS